MPWPCAGGRGLAHTPSVEALTQPSVLYAVKAYCENELNCAAMVSISCNMLCV